MIEKKRLKRNYVDVQTNIDDFNNLSEGILNITKLPEVFTSGKNVFKFSPNFDVVDIGYPIYIEILDSSGEPVFHEVLEFQEKDDSINVVVYVYETTKPGDCILTILSTIFVDRDGNPLNADEVFEQNYKYTHNLKINTKKKNDSEIIYLHYPQISIQEKRYSILEEKFDPEKQKTISGSADYFLSDGQVPILRARENLFKKDYENATIWFPYLSNEIIPNLTTSSFSYTSSIQKVLTPYQIFLDSRVYATSSMEVSNEIISSINQPYYITYNKIPLERNSTKNIKSFAVVDIYNLDPEAGHVSRVKVFGKSATKPNQSYELFYDGAITEKNYLVTASNYFVELPIGVFGDEIKVFDFETKVTGSINPYSYWKTTSIKGAPTATIASSSTYLLNPISVKPNAILSDKQEIILEQKSEYSANFNDNTVYSLIFDYSVEENSYDNREPLLNVYASGSSFVNNTEYGAFVAEVPLTNRDDRFGLDYSVKLPVNSAGTGVIKFLLRDGTSISNIRIVSETDFGFTPNISRLYVPIKIDHRNEFLDFKIEYFNDSLQQANITSEIYSVFFNGGNVYIYGDDSYITGSQEVGNDSVIKSEGYKGLDEAKKNVLENNPLYYYYRTTTRGINSLYVKNNDNTLWAWGYNVSGQLGLGDKVNRSSPIQVGTLKNWASASAGDDYTIAVKTDGTIWGWGSNTYRRAGITGSGAASTSSPVQIGTETNWNKVFAGTNHSLGMKRDGSLWAWGRNNNGQLGLNDSVTRSSPVQVGTETNWKDAAVAQATTVAIKNDGTLWSWGSNDSTSGRRTVETPTVVNRSLPVRIGTLSNWTSVVGNQYHYIALNTLGELWTWGEGGNGVLGQVTDTLAKSSPVQIGTLKTWVSASAGKYHSLAVKNDGTLWGWGYNFRGALGQDDLIPRSSPVQIGTGSNWLYTHGGQDFTFGIDRTGSFYAWGDNEFGQLGLNSTSHYSSSIRISTSSVRQLTSSLFGWSFNVGDPFNSGIKQNSVQLINEEGAYLDFATYPPLLDLTFKGSSSRLYVESESGSILWDGKKIVVTGVEISSSVIVGSLLTGSLPDGVVSGSPQTLEHLYGTNIVSSSEQRFVLGLAETDSPRFTNLTLDGDLTARQYIVSSSVYVVTQSFSSGSTIFGNDTNDNHEFTGSLRVLGNTHEITGSVYTLGDVHIDGDLYADILISTASYAIFAETASILMGTGTGSFSGSFTGSFDATGSFTGSHFGSASLSGSFDGIFFGQGSGSFSGSHFGSASLSGSFDGTFSGQGSGSFSGSHFGSASLSGSFDGIFYGQGSGSFSGSHYGDFYGLAGSINGNFTGSFSGSFTGSFDATGSFTGSHFGYHEGTASLSGSFTGSLSGTASYAETASYLLGYGIGQFTGSFSGSFTGSFDATGSFSGSHFGSASLSGSFDGILFGQGSGSFSGSHFGSASLSGSFQGEFDGTVVNGIVRGYPNTYQHILGGNYTASNIITVRNGGTPQPHVYQNNDILFKDFYYVPNSFVFSGSTFFTAITTPGSENYNDYLGRGRFGSTDTYYKNIVIGRNPLYDQTINLNANTKVSPGATLTVNRLVVRDASDWPYGTPAGFAMIYPASAKIEGLEGTGSLQGSFTGSARVGILSASQANLTGSLRGAFTGSATGSFYASASIGNMQRFVGIGSSSFIGVSNPGTASFIGLASSASLVQVFEAGTNQGWTIPTWAQTVTIICIGGGGAGGPGAYRVSSTQNWLTGGSGGGGGDIVIQKFSASDFNPSTRYQVSVGGGGVASLGIDDIPLATDNSYKRDGGASTFGKSDGSQYPFVIAYGGYGGSRGINTAAGSISGSTSYPTNLAYYIKKEGNGYIPGGAGGIGLVSGSVNGRTGYDDGWLNFRTKATSVGVDTGSLDAFDLPPSHYNFANEFVRDFELFFRNITSKVSTTGGGGGGGISRTNVGYRGGRGGAIANLRDTNFAVNWINAEPPKDSIGITKFDNPITNTSAPSLRFYNTLIGMGGRGGSRQTGFLDLPTAGGKYGGGGGGGRATTTNQTTTPTDSYGAAGGNGVVVIISEA
jgi:alpha-tubulin suppressor-like RCC1 family protein